MEPMTKRGRSGGRVRRTRLPGRSAARPLVDLERLVRDLVLVEHEREGAERCGLDRVDARIEELGVHLADQVGPGEHEVLVATFERESAEIVGAEVVALHPGAERTVEHEHALAQGIEEGGLRAATDRRCAAAGVDHRSRLRGGVLLPESINSRPVPLTIETSSAAADKVRADLLAVPVFADRRLGPGAEAVDRALGGDLADFMDEADFSGKRGETLAVPTQGKLGAKAVILVGVGDAEKLDADAVRKAGAALARRAAKVATRRDDPARGGARLGRRRGRRAGAGRGRAPRVVPIPQVQG